uniref:Uncharacterized protein n=1 Tax=Arundo donax TaxID=35708 RepID=A0A0A9HPT2_ARUDO
MARGGVAMSRFDG